MAGERNPQPQTSVVVWIEGWDLVGIPVEEAEEAIFAIALNVRGQVK